MDMAIYALNYTLKAEENLRLGIVSESATEVAIQTYLEGGLNPKALGLRIPLLSNDSNSMAEKLHEYVHTNFIRKRNEKMAAHIIDILKKKPDSYFFASGALHFIGEDNIPDMLRSSGLRVEHVKYSISDCAVPQPKHTIIPCLIFYTIVVKLNTLMQ